MPLAEEIGKAYASYYTHVPDTSGSSSPLKLFYLGIKRRWLNDRYGYLAGASETSSGGQAKKTHWFFPMLRQPAFRDVRFLPFVEKGKLLDVGCGSGQWLVEMKNLGWIADGVDFDPMAVKAACAMGLDVRVGSVEDQNFPTASYDAITLSHVIEHVPDPIGTIKECARLLKPGGRLVLFTPNASSLCHRYFKQDWRGLEPPRHLHIFSLNAMRKMFANLDFQHVSVQPETGTSVTFESYLLRRYRPANVNLTIRRWRNHAFWRLFSIFQYGLIGLVPSIGECQVVVAIKR
jgi:2-polyprenyl-3-methyl-5-hydroxy-6-metoxy-1,4-benzoquinol methylase